LVFLAARSIALAYVSVYMGGLDGRLFFPSYTVGQILSVALLLETIQLLIARWGGLSMSRPNVTAG